MNTDGKPEQHDTRKRPVIKLAVIILLLGSTYLASAAMKSARARRSALRAVTRSTGNGQTPAT